MEPLIVGLPVRNTILYKKKTTMKSSDGSKINQNQLWFFSSTRQRRERKTIREEKYSRLDGEKMESTALVVPCSIQSYRGECGWCDGS